MTFQLRLGDAVGPGPLPRAGPDARHRGGGAGPGRRRTRRGAGPAGRQGHGAGPRTTTTPGAPGRSSPTRCSSGRGRRGCRPTAPRFPQPDGHGQDQRGLADRARRVSARATAPAPARLSGKHTLALTNRGHGPGRATCWRWPGRSGPAYARSSASPWSRNRSWWGVRCEFGTVRRLGADPVDGHVDDQAGRRDRTPTRWPWSATRRAGGGRPSRCPTDGVGEFDYGFRLDGGDTVLPDPRSRRQPDGVHGWSRTYDPDALRLDRRELDRPAARGRGDLRAARRHLHPRGHPGRGDRPARPPGPAGRRLRRADAGQRLQRHRTTGATTACCGTPCTRPYGGRSATSSSSTPAMPAGSAVIQDVVYNHLGPSGNYLPQFGPYLNEGGVNTWGQSPNLDGEDSDEVRRYIIDNALDVPHRLPRRRAAAGRGARPARHPGHAHLLEELNDRRRRPAAPSWAGRCR